MGRTYFELGIVWQWWGDGVFLMVGRVGGRGDDVLLHLLYLWHGGEGYEKVCAQLKTVRCKADSHDQLHASRARHKGRRFELDGP